VNDLRKVYVEITSDCNLQCGMCMRNSWEDPIRSMSPETFANLVSHLRRIPSVSVVNFSGFGEPTVHPLFLEFLLSVKEAGLRAELVTNGIALKINCLEKLIELELDKLVVSLDGAGSSADGAFHSDSLERIHANLRNLYAMKIVRKLKRPEVGIEIVVSQRNVDELPALKRLAWKLGFSSILVSNLVPYTADLAKDVLYQRGTTARWDGKPSVWNPTVDLPRLDRQSEARQALEKLCAVGTRVRVGGSDVVGGAMDCRFVNEGCVAIAPDGNVSPCLPLLHNYGYYFRQERRRVQGCHFGKVNQSSLQEIWETAEYQAFRKRVRDFEFSPCIDCGGCDLRETNEKDCFGNEFPSCGECLWAAGLVQCP
jgi:MoaA/NifB/PqqE/SkfB family radical SAM enzyme